HERIAATAFTADGLPSGDMGIFHGDPLYILFRSALNRSYGHAVVDNAVVVVNIGVVHDLSPVVKVEAPALRLQNKVQVEIKEIAGRDKIIATLVQTGVKVEPHAFTMKAETDARF